MSSNLENIIHICSCSFSSVHRLFIDHMASFTDMGLSCRLILGLDESMIDSLVS